MARLSYNLDKDWRFHFGDVASGVGNTHSDSYALAKAGGAAGPATKYGYDTDGDGWRAVDLPHDYFTETDFAPDNLLSHGYKTRGNAWYRKTFLVDEENRGKTMTLVFEGMSVEATVYLNGSIIGRSFSAYTELAIDVTDRLYFGDTVNTLAVRIGGFATEGWWYEGAGIYRHVMLYAKSPLHIENNGLWIKPQHIDGTDNDWTVTAEASLKNTAYADAAGSIRATIYDGETVVAQAESDRVICPADGTATAKTTMIVRNPVRWDVEEPKLYRVRVELIENGAETDADETRIGFRTIAADPERGFLLNGRVLKLKGTCNHQDHAGVGVAVPDSVQYYRIRRLKEMGTNAYRCSHNLPTKAVLDACDEYGLVVMDENRRFESSPEVLSYVETMVRRDRNHPSVVFYSLFNEEPLQSTPEGRRIYKRMRALVDRLDDTRLVTGAINDTLRPEGTGLEMDITGINYNIGGIETIHEKFPHQPIIGSENNSAVTTRGCYKTDRDAHVLANYDEEVVPWGQSIKETWDFVRSHDYMAGIFIWTGFDYRGEPTPFTWPSCSSQFGIMDTCGFAKESFYQNKACFTDEPMLHLFPHWNWRCGETIRVMTATNCDEVELFVNGVSQGRKKSDVCAPCDWYVPFAPGKITANGYQNGTLVCTDTRETTGDPVQLVIEPDRDYICDDGEDTVPLKVYVTDACGRMVPTADNHVSFTVEGDGRIIGVGNGDPNSHESDTLPERDLYCGLCQALVMADVGARSLTITASGEGLCGMACTLTIRKTARPRYIYMSENHSVTGIRVSQECFAEKPDPNREYADNDMNSFAALTLSNDTYQTDFTSGWRLYRLPIRVPATAKADAAVELSIPKLRCARIESYRNGDALHTSGTHDGDAVTIPLSCKPGEIGELRLLLCAHEGSEPSGICGSVTLSVH